MKDVIVNTKQQLVAIKHWLRRDATGKSRIIGKFDKKFVRFKTRNGTQFNRAKGDDVTYTIYEFEIEADAILFKQKFG